MTREELSKEERKKRARKRRRRNNILLLVCFLICIASITADVFLAIMYKNQKSLNSELSNKNEELIEQREEIIAKYNSEDYISVEELGNLEEDIKQEQKNRVLKMFEDGESILTILETIYSEKIVVPDTGNYYFFDVREDLAKHGLENEKFTYPEYNEESKDYEGELSYSDENVSIKKGIDVSKFQGDINWDKVKNDGIDFAYIRVGYRGYETGKIVEDEKFKDNIEGANNAGLDVGVYFFTEAKSEAEGREEAEYVVDLIKESGYGVNLPIVLDVEQSANTSKSRTKNLTSEERTNIVIAFCERVKELGYTPMIYGNLKSHMRMTDIDRLEEYDKWFAYYRFPLRYPYKFRVWQYTSTGRVDGISGDTDLNIAIY